MICSACQKQVLDPPISNYRPPTIKEISRLDIKIDLLSDTQLQLFIFNNFYFPAQKLRLEFQNQALDSVLLEQVNGIDQFMLDFPFERGKPYDLVLETNRIQDTIFQYRIENYQHNYISSFHYEKLVSNNHRTDFDISPTRKTLFFSEYANNLFILKKLDLQSGQLSILDENFENGNMIRSLSEESIIYGSRFWEGRHLQDDSLAIILLNVITKQKKLLDFGSYISNRYSRIVDGYFQIPNPSKAEKKNKILKLGEEVSVVLESNFHTTHTHFFDQIYLGNKIFDGEKNELSLPFEIPENASIFYYRKEEPYSLVEVYEFDDDHIPKSKIQVVSKEKVIFEDALQDDRLITFPKILQAQNDKILFFQEFVEGPEILFNGYYEIDLNKKSIELIQHDGQNYLKHDFQLINGTIISVRQDGIYRLTRK